MLAFSKTKKIFGNCYFYFRKSFYKKTEISVLTASSRYSQSAALKFDKVKNQGYSENQESFFPTRKVHCTSVKIIQNQFTCHRDWKTNQVPSNIIKNARKENVWILTCQKLFAVGV